MYSKTKTDLLVVGGQDVADTLEGKELAVIDIIRAAYEAHAAGLTSVPHSIFLRFPGQPKDRIIGLPAYVGTEQPVAGMKWVSSFPENLAHGLPRASATLVLNSTETGRPYAFLEGSLISAQRTAASAALAAKVLSRKRPTELSIIGCGPINMAVCRFVLSVLPGIVRVRIYDVDQSRARLFADMVKSSTKCDTIMESTFETAVRGSSLVSIATTALQPHIDDIDLFADNCVVLHVSLRDFTPKVIGGAVNVVDDLDHVNREGTSIHLAAQTLGHTNFVAADLGDILTGAKRLTASTKPIIFSPFGLGILDVKLGQYVYQQAVRQKIGQAIANFFPETA